MPAASRRFWVILLGAGGGKARLLTDGSRRENQPHPLCSERIQFHCFASYSQVVYKKAISNSHPSTFCLQWDQFGPDCASKERLVVFIDEFTYMMAADPTLASNLQKIWDAVLENTNIFLCISGSHLGMMLRGILSGTAPLYGRTTAKMELKPLPFGVTKAYFRHYSAPERVMLYSVFGGIPHYWRLIDQNKSISDNIKRLVLSPGGNLRDEPRILLNDYISDPNNYIAILRAIANGYATPKEIETFTGIPNVHLSQYICIGPVGSGQVDYKAPPCHDHSIFTLLLPLYPVMDGLKRLVVINNRII